MCGIAGIVRLHDDAAPPARSRLEAMVACLRHRGPDEAGLYLDGHAALGHARLSIIDLAGGQQPLCNESGSLWITFNGEIYNHVELADELRARGHAFRTRSDTEVIVHAVEEWGEAAFGRFNGQFAIALWDALARRLVLARDRFGVRPLYHATQAGQLLFASEVKAIFAGSPELPRALDPAGLAETFTFWTPVAPQTVFRGITELEPGHVRTIEPGSVREVAFWTPDYPAEPALARRASRGHQPGGALGAATGLVPQRGAAPGVESAGGRVTLADATERVAAALAEAVRLRTVRADVPVGSYLSGGLDSSLVAVLGRRAAHGPFATFSFAFEDPEYDERRHQHRMAEHLGSEHHEILVTRGQIADVFPAVVAHAERPLLRTAAAPLYLLSRLVHESGSKVVLTGEGADEMFAGYDLFREAQVRRFWARQPASRLRPLLLRRLYPWLARSPVAQEALARRFFGQGLERWREPAFGHDLRWRSAAALQRLFGPAMREAAGETDVVARLIASLPPAFDSWAPLARDQYLEIRTLLSGYLLASQGDRMLMAHSVEGRFPFLDPEVVALANGLPPELKLRGLVEKLVLRRVAAELLPAAIRGRPKQPLRAPDAASFTAPGAPDWVAAVLVPSAVRDAGVFEPALVERLWRKCAAAEGTTRLSNADNMALVGVLSTGLLHEQLIRSLPAPGPVPTFRTVVDRQAGDGAARPAPTASTDGGPR